MSRVMETGVRLELHGPWEYMKKKCLQTGNRLYEGLPMQEGWEDFEVFVKDNWRKYYRAKLKWKNYKRVAPRKGLTGKIKTKKVRLTRKVKEDGYTIENTVFTSLSDMMKYHRTTHKYMFDGRLLGTRDIKRILKKRGIDIGMEALTRRLTEGVDVFAPSKDGKHKWRGKHRSFVEIAEMEGVGYDVLKRQYYRFWDMRKAMDYSRQAKGLRRYEFEGDQLLSIEICRILSQRTGIAMETIYGRFKKYGLDMKRLVCKLGYKGYSGTAKPIVAIKNGKEKTISLH